MNTYWKIHYDEKDELWYRIWKRGWLVGCYVRFSHFTSHISRTQMKVAGCLTALIFNAIISFFFPAAATDAVVVAMVIALLLRFVSFRGFNKNIVGISSLYKFLFFIALLLLLLLSHKC